MAGLEHFERGPDAESRHCPATSTDGLRIRYGATCRWARRSVEIARLLFVAQKIAPEERDRVRKDLLNYCERDTWAMVKLLERLRELARS